MKKLFYLLLLSTQLYAQAPTKLWDKTIGGNSFDYASSIIATSDGGFVIAGSAISGISGDKSEASKGVYDYWIVKLNSTGQKMWDKTIGGNDGDHANSIIATSDGGFIITGISYSGISGDKSETHRGVGDYWIIKLNSTGQKVWDKTIGGSDGDYAASTVETSDGGFVIGGYSYSGISGDKSEGNKGFSDYWIVKLNSTGQQVWDKTIGGNSYDFANSIIATPEGGFIIAGYSDSGISGDKTEASKGNNNDYWIVKLNSTGQKVWDKTFGGNGYDFGKSIIATADGGFAIAGSSSSGISGDKSEANQGSYDYWIIKFNSIGQKIWDKTIGGNLEEGAHSIIATSDGGFAIAGSSSSGISGNKSEANQGLSDYWIVKLNSSGLKVWDKTIGGDLEEVAFSIIETSDGGLVIAGISTSDISGDKTEVGQGENDYWIVNLNYSVVETIASNEWNTNITWNTNTPPTAVKTAKINAHTISISNTGNQVKTIQMNGGTINLIGGTLEIKNQ